MEQLTNAIGYNLLFGQAFYLATRHFNALTGSMGRTDQSSITKRL